MKKLTPKEKARDLFKKHGLEDSIVNFLQIKELAVEEKDRNYWERVGVYLTIIRDQEVQKKKANPLDWNLS